MSRTSVGELLARAGLTADERASIEAHLAECPECREMTSDGEAFASAGRATRPPWPFVTEWLARRRADRFHAAAQQRGFEFSDRVRRGDRTVRRAAGGDWRAALARLHSPVVAGVLFVALIVGALAIVQQRQRLARLGAENAALQRENVALRTGASAPRVPDRQADIDRLNSDLEQSRQGNAALAARAAALETELHHASASLETLRLEAAEAAAAASAQTTVRLQESKATLDAANAELAALRRERAEDAVVASDQESRITALTARVDELTENLGRERQLLAAGRDIRELMGARNLHVIDVFDVDGRGRTRQSFGRVFYTEGKSLIFYAFDLAAARTASNRAFQAWGYKEAADQARGSTRSLGIFYVDDSTQNRWVLKSEDPKVLAEIDSVFVTIEPPGGSMAPSGQKLLYAYLRHSPNHP